MRRRDARPLRFPHPHRVIFPGSDADRLLPVPIGNPAPVLATGPYGSKSRALAQRRPGDAHPPKATCRARFPLPATGRAPRHEQPIELQHRQSGHCFRDRPSDPVIFALRGLDAPRDDIPERAIASIKRRMPFAMCFSTVLSETFIRWAVSR